MDKGKLVDKHLKGMNELMNSSVKKYSETGQVTGTLKMCLIEMLQEFEEDVRKGNQTNSKPANCAIFDVSGRFSNEELDKAFHPSTQDFLLKFPVPSG